MTLSLAEIEHVASIAAQKAVDETLIRIGINTADPIASQQDFAKLRALRDLMDDEGFQADLVHLRRWRLACSAAGRAAGRSLIGAAVAALLALLTLGTKDWIAGLFHK